MVGIHHRLEDAVDQLGDEPGKRYGVQYGAGGARHFLGGDAAELLACVLRHRQAAHPGTGLAARRIQVGASLLLHQRNGGLADLHHRLGCRFSLFRSHAVKGLRGRQEVSHSRANGR